MFISEVFATTNIQNESMLGSLMPLFIFVVIFYIFLIKPNQKKIKQHQAMIKQLKIGDKVVTNGGIIGIVKKNKEDKINIEISNNVEIEVLADSITSLLNKKEEKNNKKGK